MEMFSRDSDYEWTPVRKENAAYERHTVMDCDSDSGRMSGKLLRAAVWRSLNKIRPDVLIVNGWGHKESQHSLAWARKHGCPIVLLSDSAYEDAPRVWWKELVKRWIVRGSKSAFVAGSPQASYAAKLGIDAARIFYPGSCVVDNDYWAAKSLYARQNEAAIRIQLGLPVKYFLFVGRFIEKKNVPCLVRAYARYRSAAGQDAASLVLCGDGPARDEVHAEIRNAQLKDVITPGFAQIDTLPYYYALSSCFVMPSSHYEQWGLVANEAMACGTPVLLSEKCGSATDLVINGVNGFTFDPANADQLANLLDRMMSNEEQRTEMGKASQRIIADHSCAAGAENLWKAVDAARAA